MSKAEAMRMLRDEMAAQQGQASTAQLERLAQEIIARASSSDHARRAMRRWCAQSQYWPSPMEVARMCAEEPASTTGSQAQRSCRHCLGEGWEPIAWWQRPAQGARGGSYVERQAMPQSEYGASRAQDGWVPYSGVVQCRCCGCTRAERHEARAASLRLEGI